MLGYYKNEAATREVMKNDWLNTGDIGHMKGDFLFLTGRFKNVIVLSNGKNIYPEEIEDTLLSAIPLIREVVVYAARSPHGKELELPPKYIRISIPCPARIHRPFMPRCKKNSHVQTARFLFLNRCAALRTGYGIPQNNQKIH